MTATINDPAFRRQRARLAALALHHQRPDLARSAGRLGGQATVSRSGVGPKAWGLAMAMKRWNKSASDLESRAPRAGLTADGGGAPEVRPAPARSRSRSPSGEGV